MSHYFGVDGPSRNITIWPLPLTPIRLLGELSLVSTILLSCSLNLSYVSVLRRWILYSYSRLQVALVSSAIFHTVDADVDDDPHNHNTYYGKNGVAWVLRFGGLCAFVSLPFFST